MKKIVASMIALLLTACTTPTVDYAPEERIIKARKSLINKVLKRAEEIKSSKNNFDDDLSKKKLDASTDHYKNY